MAVPYTLDYVFKGNGPKRGTIGVHTAVGKTLAQYAEGAGVLASALDAFTNGILESGSITIPMDLSGLTGNTAAINSDVEEGAELGMITTAGEPVTTIIPAPPQTFFIEGSDDLDQSAPGLTELISMLENGLLTTGGTIQPTDVEQVDIVDVIRARKITKPSGTRRR